jgi:hypothetical protein
MDPSARDEQDQSQALPKAHRRSLKGVLAPFIRRTIPADADWGEIREQAWREAVREPEDLPGPAPEV